MATSTLADVALTGDWQDLVDTHGAIANADVSVENVGAGAVALVFGGATPPAGKSGTIRRPNQSVTVNTDHLWAKSVGGSGTVSVVLL